MEPFLGDGFILSSAFYPKYKPRRRHVSQAFFKEKLEALGGHLRGFLKSSITEWNNQIENGEKGYTTFDLSHDFEEILMRNTTKNAFGFDNSDTLIDWDYVEEGKVRTGKNKAGKAIFTNLNHLVSQMGIRMINPFETQLTVQTRATNRNCKSTRDFFE